MAWRLKSTNNWHSERRNRQKGSEIVVLIERSGRIDRPMAPFALIDLRKTTVELWMLLLLLLLISVAWLKTWD
jgi:hypothetical protein